MQSFGIGLCLLGAAIAHRRNAFAPCRAFRDFRNLVRIVVILVMLAPRSVAANSALSDAAVIEAQRALAAVRLQRGRAFIDKQDWQSALAEILDSVRLEPTASAVNYAALCLKKLGRHEEALDTYARLIRDYGEKLPSNEKQAVLKEIEELRRFIGGIEIHGSEPGAEIFVDGKKRGNYPLLDALRVPIGNHIVRVHKEGYAPFETSIEVHGKSTKVVSAPLRALGARGTLLVVELGARSLEVVIDGITMGAGDLAVILAPGNHVVHLRSEGNLGTQPRRVEVRANEITQLRLRAEALDATLRMEPTPFDANMSLDGIPLGRGVWEGRVRPGKHSVEVSAEGYISQKREIHVKPDKLEVVRFEPARDLKSKYWRKPGLPDHFISERSTGVMLVPSFGGDVLGSCDSGCTHTIGVGPYGVAKLGYELNSRFAFGVLLGFIGATQEVHGRETTLEPVGLPARRGRVDDILRIGTVAPGIWGGYTLDSKYPIQLRISAGAILGTVSDARHGTFTGSADSMYNVGVLVQHYDALFAFVTPEARIGYKLTDHALLSLGLEIPVWIGLWTPKWSRAQGFTAGSDGYATFKPDSLVGQVLVGIAPGIGAHFDL
jgi:hypothetical protein